MTRIHNFSAGPGVLPEPVLREAQEAIWEHGGTASASSSARTAAPSSTRWWTAPASASSAC